MTDIEALLQWAVSRSGRLPWYRDDWRELTLNPYTARPRRKPIVSWTLAQACAGLTIGGRPVPARMQPGPDAHRVLAAIQALDDPATAAIVIACARGKIRPDWMEGIEPRRVMSTRRHRKKHRRVVHCEWAPCSPEDVRLARLAYSRWHAALLLLADRLDGELAGWLVTGFAAPVEPWQPEGKKNS